MHDISLIVSIVITIVYVVVAAITLYDAFTHTDYGCAWIAGIFFLGPIAVIVYWFMKLYTDRRRPAYAEERQIFDADDAFGTRLPSDIDKLRFLRSAESRHGTMFNPTTGENLSSTGYKHFTDDKAETLINENRMDEAFEYLMELYSVALGDNDARGRDTYRHYLSRVPGGLSLLNEWEASRGIGFHEKDTDRPDLGVQRGSDPPF